MAFRPFTKGYLNGRLRLILWRMASNGPNWGLANVLLDQQMYSTKKCLASVGKKKIPIKEENKP
jgi:hypothetical protein